MGSAKRLLMLLSALLVTSTMVSSLIDWLALMGLNLAICPVLLYLSFGFCDECREYGSDYTCGHVTKRREAYEGQHLSLLYISNCETELHPVLLTPA
jgi:ATP sulfurylase